MEIEISGRPQFGFKPTLTLLQALETCALLHYDSVCKSTAAPGGLIHREIQSLGFLGPQSAYVSWCFRELDTILKVCENPPRILEANAMACLTEFVISANKALHAANAIMSEWKIVIDPIEGENNVAV